MVSLPPWVCRLIAVGLLIGSVFRHPRAVPVRGPQHQFQSTRQNWQRRKSRVSICNNALWRFVCLDADEVNRLHRLLSMATLGDAHDAHREDGSAGSDTSDKDAVKSSGTPQERGFFHVLLMLVSCYAAMILTNWGRTDGAPAVSLLPLSWLSSILSGVILVCGGARYER